MCTLFGLGGCILVPDHGGGPERDNDRHEGDRRDHLGAGGGPAPLASGWYAAPARLPHAMAGRYAMPQLRAAILYTHRRRVLPHGIWT
jgi:hypothetical protein